MAKARRLRFAGDGFLRRRGCRHGDNHKYGKEAGADTCVACGHFARDEFALDECAFGEFARHGGSLNLAREIFDGESSHDDIEGAIRTYNEQEREQAFFAQQENGEEARSAGH